MSLTKIDWDLWGPLGGRDLCSSIVVNNNSIGQASVVIF